MTTIRRRSAFDVLHALATVRVLPVATLAPDTAERVGSALVQAGLPCIEITCRAATATEAIRRALEVPGLLVGAGTVLEPGQAVEVAQAGAAFAVSPALDPAVVARCRELGMPFFPGVATPTEIQQAVRLGIDTVKVFPAASLGGASYLRALAAVYPNVGFIPTGGVDQANLRDFLAVPSVVACGGSWLIGADPADDDAIEALTLRVGEALEAAR